MGEGLLEYGREGPFLRRRLLVIDERGQCGTGEVTLRSWAALNTYLDHRPLRVLCHQ